MSRNLRTENNLLLWEQASNVETMEKTFDPRGLDQWFRGLLNRCRWPSVSEPRGHLAVFRSDIALGESIMPKDSDVPVRGIVWDAVCIVGLTCLAVFLIYMNVPMR